MAIEISHLFFFCDSLVFFPLYVLFIIPLSKAMKVFPPVSMASDHFPSEVGGSPEDGRKDTPAVNQGMREVNYLVISWDFLRK